MIPTLQLGQFGRSIASGSIDPYFSQVVLLLHGENGTSQTVIDSSSHNRTQAATDSTEGNYTTFAKFGGGSVGLNIGGGGGGLTYADSADFTLGTSDFTVESFLYLPTLPSTTKYLMGSGPFNGANTGCSWSLQTTATNKLLATAYSGGSAIGSCTSTTSITANTWWYWAWGRQGSNFRQFMATSGSAVAEGTASSASSINNSADIFAIGKLGAYPSLWYSYYVDEFRWTVGTYRDVATIGVPTAAFPDA